MINAKSIFIQAAFFVSFALALLSISPSTQAQDTELKQRDFQLEWDPVEGAHSYDVEISAAQDDKRTFKVFKTQALEWSGRLIPGEYFLRIRARDLRNVPGEWTDLVPFHVGLENVKIIKPAMNAQVMSEELEKADIGFEWEPVSSASLYQIQVKSSNGEVVLEKEISETKLKASLSVAQSYSWKIQAVSANKITSDKWTESEFRLLGKLEKPDVSAPTSEFVRELEWKPKENTTSSSYQLLRFNDRKQIWEVISESAEYKNSKLIFRPEWKGGRYRFTVRAHGTDRIPSETSTIEFLAKNGQRTQAAEELETKRSSIDHLKGFYLRVGTSPSRIAYLGTNADNALSVPMQTEIPAFMGLETEIRFGKMSSQNSWGSEFTISHAAMALGSKQFGFLGFEGNAIHRQPVLARADLRRILGLFYFGKPELLGRTDLSYGVQTIGIQGIHYGIEYWYAFDSKWAFQSRFDLHQSLLFSKSPNGESLEMKPSFGLGGLVKRRMGLNHSALVGIRLKDEHISYPSQNSSLNTIYLKSLGLNFIWEWTP